MITSPKGRKFLGYISPIYEQSVIMQAIMEAIGAEWDEAERLADEVLAQLFPQTATWGIVYWEWLLGIPPNDSISIQERRARVLAKMQIRWPITKERMEQIIRTYSGDDQAYIKQYFDEYRFVVLFDISRPADLRAVFEIVSETKPAHLAWSLILTIFTKREIRHKHWIDWRIRLASCFPNSAIRLDQGYRNINGSFRLNSLVTIGPYRKIDGSWKVLREKISHRSRYNFHKAVQCGAYRPISPLGKAIDTRYKLDGRIKLDYDVQDTRWFLDGTKRIEHAAHLDGDRFIDASWSLSFAHFLDGKVIELPRNFLRGYAHVPLQVEYRTLDGSWHLGVTVTDHRIFWTKWRDGQVVERGVAG